MTNIKLSELLNSENDYEKIEINKEYVVNKIEIKEHDTFDKMLILNDKYISFSNILIDQFEKIKNALNKNGLTEYELKIRIIIKMSKNGRRYYTVEDV